MLKEIKQILKGKIYIQFTNWVSEIYKTLGKIIFKVIKLNNANNEWKVNKLIVEKLDNEYQISVSNILKDSIGIFKDKKI